jgi:hypothetical protein
MVVVEMLVVVVVIIFVIVEVKVEGMHTMHNYTYALHRCSCGDC